MTSTISNAMKAHTALRVIETSNVQRGACDMEMRFAGQGNIAASRVPLRPGTASGQAFFDNRPTQDTRLAEFVSWRRCRACEWVGAFARGRSAVRYPP
jgi:hypothetical protein